MFVCVFTCVRTCGGKRTTWRICLSHFPSCLWDRGSHLADWSTRCCSHPRSPVSVEVCRWAQPFIYPHWVSELRPSCWRSKSFISWAVCPAPEKFCKDHILYSKKESLENGENSNINFSTLKKNHFAWKLSLLFSLFLYGGFLYLTHLTHGVVIF